MEPRKSYKVFRYQTDVTWKSGRRAVISAPGRPDVEVSSPPEFKGDPGFWTPEDMYIASVNLCTLLTFVAFARHKGLEFESYESAAEGVVENTDGKYSVTEIVLHPHITLKSDTDIERARQVLEDAHGACLISNSVNTKVKIFPNLRVASAAA